MDIFGDIARSVQNISKIFGPNGKEIGGKETGDMFGRQMPGNFRRFREIKKKEDPAFEFVDNVTQGIDKGTEVVAEVVEKVVEVVRETVNPKPVKPPAIPAKPKPPVGLYLLFGGMTVAIITVVVIAVE